MLSATILEIQPGNRLIFSSVEDGVEELIYRDEFVNTMSQFDRNARCHSVTDVSTEEYLEYVGKQVVKWQAADIELILKCAQKVATTFKERGIRLPLPAVIYLIRTSGLEEANAVYTRGRHIIIPPSLLTQSLETIERIIAHELLHIAMRQDKKLETKLYALLGFKPCNDILAMLPEDVFSKRITNPDAPCCRYYKTVRYQGETIDVVPLLLAHSRYETGEFFHYLTERLVHVIGDNHHREPVMENGRPRLLSYDQVVGYFDTLGRDTDYTYHPEEVLAKYFEFFYFNLKGLKDQQISQGIQHLFIGD